VAITSTNANGAHTSSVVAEAMPPDWALLYEQHRAAMFRVAAAGLRGQRSNAAPLDMVHDAFVSVMRSPPTEVDNWEALLVLTTLRRVKDHHKRADQARTSLTTEGSEQELELMEGSTGEDIVDQVVRQANAVAVRAAFVEILGDLSTQQRDVLVRRIIEGKSVGMIAEELHTSAANVSQLLRKGLAEVVGLLQELDVGRGDIAHIRPTRRGGEGS
jgi:RNA polymerase sigma factor (sigma-70 family)